MVLRTADELKYRPNRLISGVQNQRSQVVGVLFASAGEYYSEMMVGIQGGLAERDALPLTILDWQNLSRSRESAQLSEREFHWIHRLVEHRVDGIIFGPIAPDIDARHLQEIHEHHMPVVAVDIKLSRVPVDFVGTNDEQAGRDAATHLLAQGHRRLLCLISSMESTTAIDRLKGMQAAVRDTPDAELLTHLCHGYSIDEGYWGLKRFLEKEKPPTGIIAVCDELGVGAIRCACDLGFAVPRQLSIIGFGNSRVGLASNPPLTTMDQQVREVGRLAALQLMRLIDNRNEELRPEESILVPTQLIERGSVAACNHDL